MKASREINEDKPPVEIEYIGEAAYKQNEVYRPWVEIAEDEMSRRAEVKAHSGEQALKRSEKQ